MLGTHTSRHQHLSK